MRDYWGMAVWAKLAKSDDFDEVLEQAETQLQKHPGCPRLAVLRGLVERLSEPTE